MQQPVLNRVFFLIGLIGIFLSLSSPVHAFTMGQSLSNSSASLIGEDAGDLSGIDVNVVGDVNGDGYQDFAIGAMSDEEGGANAGQTYVFFGSSSGWTIDTSISSADASFIGEDAGDGSGESVSGAGDVNNDGYDDILIGAAGDDDGGNAAGQTYLILGKASGWAMDVDLSAADASFIGENADDQSGKSVSGTGDVNNDGYDDFIIGAYRNDAGGSDAGQTYLILGKANGWAMDVDLSAADASFIGESTNNYSGLSVDGLGDVNNDGFDDFIIGALGNGAGGSNAGQSYVIFGKAGSWSMDTSLASADASFIGEDAYDSSGETVSRAGDVDNDGYDDILIGAYGDDDGGDEAGQTYLILGKASGWAMDVDLSAADASFIGEKNFDDSGYTLSAVGDVNNDTYDDFLVGAYCYNEGSCKGQTYLILGKASGWAMDVDLSAADASFIGEANNDFSGFGLAGGDINGDGYSDMIISAYQNDAAGSNAGQTYLIFGNNIIVTQSGGTTEVTEGGATDSIDLVLTSYTAQDVTVTLSSTNSDLAFSQTSIIFTSANWNTPQTVTVSAVNDSVVEGNRTDTIHFAVSSIDTGYDTLNMSNVSVNIIEDDVLPTSTPTSTPTPTPTQAPTSTPQPAPTLLPLIQNRLNNGQDANGECVAQKPGGMPQIFKIDMSATKATLYIAPPSKPYDHFFISYKEVGNITRGNSPSLGSKLSALGSRLLALSSLFEHPVYADSPEYAIDFSQTDDGGVVVYTINDLKPNTQYEFTVRCANKCAFSETGNTLGAATVQMGSPTLKTYLASNTTSSNTDLIPDTSLAQAGSPAGIFIVTGLVLIISSVAVYLVKPRDFFKPPHPIKYPRILRVRS